MRKQPNSYHCFVCGVKNVSGVHVEFFDTVSPEGKPEVLAVFTGRPAHQGYPGRMHGGIITGILDEAIGRAINSGAQEGVPTVWGVTVDVRVLFQKPVPLDVELTARGRITHEERRVFEGEGELFLPDGTVAVTATGKYVKLLLDAISEVDLETLGWRVYEDGEALAHDP
jgi:acyl-coenzyme A thioesterase PaaI-like protein